MDLTCYNKGCGQSFLEEENNEDSCIHHPGVPVFHDAYKGWSCCSKKCTDFTEFLNFKGCSKSKHSNVKPPEVGKCTVVETVRDEPKPSNSRKSLPRPPLDTPMTELSPVLAPSAANRISAPASESVKESAPSVTTGTACKRGGCKKEYPDPGPCDHHPGYPVFHEGLKFWSCCTRKTPDFETFMEQAGCVRGETHMWPSSAMPVAACRIDWHQTASLVVVSLFSRDFLPTESTVRLSPVRLQVNLVFPGQASQKLDMHLAGLVSVEESRVDMFGTKVEVKLRKAEPGSWARLGQDLMPQTPQPAPGQQECNTVALEAIDLSDL